MPLQNLIPLFKELFAFLRAQNYFWLPLSPAILTKLRNLPQNELEKRYDSLTRFFGVGAPVTPGQVEQWQFSPALRNFLMDAHLSISVIGDYYICHHHLPYHKNKGADPVYFGNETLRLIEWIRPHRNTLEDKNVLDLGCGSGALGFAFSSTIKNYLGLDLSNEAILWAEASAAAQGGAHLYFEHAKIGDRNPPLSLQTQKWDVALSNPPMVLSEPGESMIYRDGGPMGIEIPLKFLDFAHQHLQPGGRVFCLSTNPILNGKSLFFDQLKRRSWSVLSKNCFEDYFNQNLATKFKYHERGISKIELWGLHLQKKES